MKTYKAQLPELILKYKKGNQKKFKITSSKDSAKALMHMFSSDLIDYREEFIIIYLNQANNSIGWLKIATGGITSVIVDKRMIFATALQCGATSIILAHNHPSGRIFPSAADKRITKQIQAGAATLDIQVHDHIIVTSENGYFSFVDQGLM